MRWSTEPNLSTQGGGRLGCTISNEGQTEQGRVSLFAGGRQSAEYGLSSLSYFWLSDLAASDTPDDFVRCISFDTLAFILLCKGT